MFRLQDMRDTKKLKWPIYIGFAIIIVSFIFFYGFQPDEGRGQGAAQDVARLQSNRLNPLEKWDVISAQDAARMRGQATGEKFSQLPQQWQMMLQSNQSLIDRLVSEEDLAVAAANERLIERQAGEMGVYVPVSEVENMLRSQPNLTEAMLEAEAARLGLSKFEFVERLRKDQVEGLVRALQGTLAHASLFELWQEYLLLNEKITFRMAAFPAAEFEDQIAVTEQELQDYLTEHMDEYRVPETRRYAYVKISRDQMREEIEATSESLRVYFEQHQTDYFEPAGRRVEEIYVPLLEDDTTTRAISVFETEQPRLAASDNWSTLSQQLTEDHAGLQFYHRPAAQWLEPGSTNRSPGFMQRVMALDQDEVSSPIIETSGVYVARVTEVREGGTPSFEEVEERVREDYLESRVEEVFRETMRNWKEETRRHETLQSFAGAVGIDDELTTAVEASQTTIPGIGQISSLDRDYLIHDLKPGEISDALQTTDGLAVVQIVDPKPAYDPTMDEVRDKIEAAVRRERSVELARAAADQARNALEAGAEFDAALADAPIEPFTTDPVTRTQPVRNLSAPLIGLTQATLGVEQGSTGMTPYGYDEAQPLGYAIWRVNQLEQPTMAQFNKDREEFEKEDPQVQRLTILREWLADLRREAGFQFLDEEGNPVQVANAAKPAAAPGEDSPEASATPEPGAGEPAAAE